MAGQGLVVHGKARRGMARLGSVGHGEAGSDSRHGPVPAWLGPARQG